MTNLLLNRQSERAAKLILKDPPHAIMIVGAAGTGKKCYSEMIGYKLLNLKSAAQLKNYAYYHHLKRQDNKQYIPIESIRRLIKSLELKPPTASNIKRVVFIEDAQYLSLPAQNALLKSLEEPPPATVFILSVNSESSVLSTIGSRCHKIYLRGLDLASSKSYFMSDYRPEDIDSAYALSGGRVGLMSAILKDDANHPLKVAVDDAKLFIQAKTAYEKMLVIERYLSRGRELNDFMEALQRVLSALYEAMLAKGEHERSKQVLRWYRQTQNLANNLNHNANQKLIILSLSMSLSN